MHSYLHINGFIHRDVKAANLLIDDDGTVLLGDLGVAASLTDDADMSSRSYNDTGNRVINFDPVSPANSSCPALQLARPGMGKRQSFVGTVRAIQTLGCSDTNVSELCSPVGWRLSLFRVIVMIRRLTSGHLQ